MFKRCLENRIIHQQNNYKCCLCDYETPENDYALVLKHVELEEHKNELDKVQSKAQVIQSELLLTISETQRRKLVDNGVIPCMSSNYFRCVFCTSSHTGLIQIFDHIKSSYHIQKMKELMDNKDNKQVLKMQKAVSTNDGKNNKSNENTNNVDNVKKKLKIEDYNYIITLDRDKFLYKCTICNCQISSVHNVTEHVKGRNHLSKLNIEKPVYVKPAEIQKTAENKKSAEVKTKIDKPEQFQKAKNEKPAVGSKVENNVSNMPSMIVKIQYCSLCQIFLKSPKIVQFHSKLHLFKKFAIPYNIDIIKFKISKSGKAIIECALCRSLIANEEELEKHLNTVNHISNFHLFDKLGDIVKLNKPEFIAIQQEKLKKFETDHSKYTLSASLCTICNAHILGNNCDDHLKGIKHLSNLNNPEQSLDIKNTNSINISSSDRNKLVTYDCFLCNKNFSSFITLFCHYDTYEHQRKLKCFKMVMDSPYTWFITHNNRKMVKCTLCKTKHLHCQSTIQHLTNKNHKSHLEMVQSNTATDAAGVSNIVELKSKQIDKKTNNFANLEPKPNKKFNKNIAIFETKQNNEQNNKKVSNTKSNQNINPTLKPKTTKKKSEFETSPEELLELGFSVENLNLSHVEAAPFDDLLNDLVNFDMSGKQEKKLPLSLKGRKPRTPNTEKRKVNAFCKNVKLFGKNYIKLCINSGKENIYNVDSEDIRLMKFGCDLILHWPSEKVCLPCCEQLPNDKLVVFEHLQDKDHIKTIQEMEANDKEFEDYPDQFSDLKLAHLFMVEESEDSIQCYACNSKVKNDNLDVHRHSLLADHLSKSQHWKKLSGEMFQEFSNIFKDIWYYAQVFICEICQTKCDFEIDFVMHLESEKHKNNVGKLKCKFYLCPVCITYWYGQSNSFKIHCKDSYHKRLASNGDLMVPNMTRNASIFLSSISLKVTSMIEESNKAVFEKYKELTLTEAIEEAVQCKYPKAKAYIFGSRISQLAFCDSDVDVFLDCEGVYYDSTTQEQCQKYLSSIRCYFENKPNVWIVEEIIMVSRVPIIKLRHIPTQLKCDISFINGLSVEKSTLIGNYCKAYTVCRELILYLKKWLNICQISGSDGITTFAISWFVIFYLQVQEIFPSVYDLIRKNNLSKIVDGWECGFLEIIPVSSSVSNLDFTDHLYNFFSYYANFDYKTEVICPYLGKVIKKSTFAYSDNLPKEMKLYKDRLKAEKGDIFRFDSPMCIQDPIDLSQNITKAVKKLQLRRFRQYCTDSAIEVLKEIKT